jgi:hypothetical protein
METQVGQYGFFDSTMNFHRCHNRDEVENVHSEAK